MTTDEPSTLAGITAAAVLGRAATGARAGSRIRRLGADPEARWIPALGPRALRDVLDPRTARERL